MTADIVVGGLGGDGPIVTAGLGLAGAPDPNSMRAVLRGTGTLSAELTASGSPDMAASLNGSGSLTATLTDANAVTPAAGYFGGYAYPVPPRPRTRPGWIAATLAGTSTMTADLDFTLDFDAELRQLMLLGVV